MGRDQPANVAVSVRQRLLNRARHQKQDYQVLLTRYILERFLYRLSQSPHQDRFVVKGAMLFLLWEGEFHRTTRDLDLLALGSSEIAPLEAAVREICTAAVEEDGVVFHPETIRGRAIREDQIYDGVRVTVATQLAQHLLDGHACAPDDGLAEHHLGIDFDTVVGHGLGWSECCSARIRRRRSPGSLDVGLDPFLYLI